MPITKTIVHVYRGKEPFGFNDFIRGTLRLLNFANDNNMLLDLNIIGSEFEEYVTVDNYIYAPTSIPQIFFNDVDQNNLITKLIEFNNASIRIFNLKGNLVYESHNMRSSHLEILDFNFENGVYIIEIQNGNKIEHFKLLKAS